jgi:hypothetical protein
MDADRLAASQLQRMRGMTALYHKQFFSDIRFTLVALLGVFAAGLFGAEPLFLAAPPIALLGAAQTAFDASYLIFARHYAARLEHALNESAGRRVLVAADLEARYLFPLNIRKVVTIAGGESFSWFGFMTVLYTLVGVGAFVAGLAASITSAFPEIGTVWAAVYLAALTALTLAALAVGWWWFWGGEGERRLRHVLDDAFGR